MDEFWQRLQQRMIVQWAIAYVAFWFAFLQGVDIVAQRFEWHAAVERYLILALAIGFCVTLVLAWYHGERGAQRVSGTELLIIALLLGIGGAGMWRFGPVDAQRGDAPAAAIATAAPAPSIRATAPEPAAVDSVPAKSIAVLPFENLSDDKKNDYFVAGMQGMILTKLAGIGDLKVISRTSTGQYKSRPDDLKQVGEQLGVAAILEGSVQKDGDQVLINVQLIDARTDSHRWAESYTRTLDNVFGVEGEVAEKIAAALNATLSRAEGARLATVPTSNRAAMDLFLRAEFQAGKGDLNFDTAGWQAAIPLYRQAVTEDPDFALAWARLSLAENGLAWFGGGGLDTRQLSQQSRADAERALALQPNLSTAYLAIGYDDALFRGDHAGALNALAAALRLKPSDADAIAARGFVERRQGHFDTALASLQQALAFDPRNSILAFEIGGTEMMLGRYAEAENWLQRALALDADNLNAKVQYANAILLGSADMARAMQAVQGDAPALQLARVTLLTRQRQYKEAARLLDGIADTPATFRPGRDVSKALLQADLYRLTGDTEQARPLFEQALAQARGQLANQQRIIQAFAWRNCADAELGLGRTREGLDAIAAALAIADQSGDHFFGPLLEYDLAALYAKAGRPNLAVPLLAKALASPGVGLLYSPVLLWLDPVWDPLHGDARFQALQEKYAKDKPAVILEATISGNQRHQGSG